jgi:hypothetical protein
MSTKLTDRASQAIQQCLDRASLPEEVSPNTLRIAADLIRDLEAARTSALNQRDMVLESLHKLGTKIGLLDSSVACDGPQLISAVEAYCDEAS